MTTRGRNGRGRRRRARPRTGRRVRRALAGLASVGVVVLTIGAGLGVVPVADPSGPTYVTADALPGGSLFDRAISEARGSRAGRQTPLPNSDRPEKAPTAAPTTPREPTTTPTTPSPEPIEVPTIASGDLVVVDGDDDAPRSAGRTITYRVEVEEGLPFDSAEVAEFVHRVLQDDRGWPGVLDVRFRRTAGDAELRVILASPALTDELCYPLDTGGTLSCRIEDRVVLNGMRWAAGTPDYGDDLIAYRTYLVNHEVGHALGYGHSDCPGEGEPAPVMMQQTKGVDECEINPWPTVAATS